LGTDDDHKSALQLQLRLLQSLPVLSGDLLGLLQKRLFLASDRDEILNPPQDIRAVCQRTEKSRDHYQLLIGDPDLRREGHRRHVLRSDGARITGTVTVKHVNKDIELIAYSWQLANLTGPTHSSPSFLRFDLDQPGGAHDGEGLRSHLHPGNDDWRVPFVVLHPLEMLDMLLRVGRT
jgi:hypothetical protein